MAYCSLVASVGLTKKRFGHHAILKILSLRSQSDMVGEVAVDGKSIDTILFDMVCEEAADGKAVSTELAIEDKVVLNVSDMASAEVIEAGLS